MRARVGVGKALTAIPTTTGPVVASVELRVRISLNDASGPASVYASPQSISAVVGLPS